MAKTIISFPKKINRSDFAHWLSGFSDGEGCFRLRLCRMLGFSVSASFAIAVRDDDLPVIKLILRYFQVGTIRNGEAYRKSKPICTFSVNNLHDLIKVVEHFDKFPLRAKKKKDYRIWREGVLLIRTVGLRKRQGRGRGPGGVGRGYHPKWLIREKHKFTKLVTLLKEQRKYRSHSSKSNLPEEFTV